MNYFEASVVSRLRKLVILRRDLLEKLFSRLHTKPRAVEFHALEDLFVDFLKKISISIHTVQFTIQESLSISALFAISVVSLLVLLMVLVTWLMHM